MKTITITPTGEKREYHAYFKPFICTTDIDLPKMINRGYNSFDFVESVDFKFSFMPIEKSESFGTFKKEETTIQVIRKDSSTVSGTYYRYTILETGATSEKVDFS